MSAVQQINLLPLRLAAPAAPRWSARSLLQALGLLAGGLLLLCGWTLYAAARAQQDLAQASASHASAKAALAARLDAAGSATAADPVALSQELAAARQRLADRLAVRDDLRARRADGAALLTRLAETAPPTLWLTSVRRADRRIELAGFTQRPDELQAWSQRLSADPLFAATSLRVARVERNDDGAGWRFVLAGGAAAKETP